MKFHMIGNIALVLLVFTVVSSKYYPLSEEEEEGRQ